MSAAQDTALNDLNNRCLSEISVLLPGKLHQRAKLIAQQKGPILIRGMSGTGKTLVSRLLHRFSKNESGPFVVRRCCELEPSCVNKILFGEENGESIGNGGLFEKTKGGTLVLDDIDQLPISAQARLVRYLDEQSFSATANLLLITTTSRDLDGLVRKGSFLLDLWYQLRKWRLKTPSLKERARDIRHLASFFLHQFQAENPDLMGPDPAFFSEEVLYLFGAMPWHGNLRELKDAVHNLALFIEGPKTPIHLKQAAEVIFDREYSYRSSSQNAPQSDREYIYHVLESTGWNTSLSSRITGLSRSEITEMVRDNGWKQSSS